MLSPTAWMAPRLKLVAERLEAAGADAVGCNCSTGPAAVLQRDRAHARDAYPPAAGGHAERGPAAQCGRPAHLPELAGVYGQLRGQSSSGPALYGWVVAVAPRPRTSAPCVGSCAPWRRRRKGEALGFRQRASATVSLNEKAVTPEPLARRSHLGRKIAAGEWVTMVEIVPPKGFDCARELDGAALLAARGVDAINVPDSPRASARMSAGEPMHADPG